MESTGHAKAEAESRAESARIEGEAAVEQGTKSNILLLYNENILSFE